MFCLQINLEKNLLFHSSVGTIDGYFGCREFQDHFQHIQGMGKGSGIIFS